MSPNRANFAPCQSCQAAAARDVEKHFFQRVAIVAPSRPQLLPDADSGLAELEKMMYARAAAYEQARHVEVSVENRTPAEIAATVIGLMTLTFGFR